MTQFEPGISSDLCPFPKSRRKKYKSKSGMEAWRNVKITDAGIEIVKRHNDILGECEYECEKRGLKYLHVPDVVYQLCDGNGTAFMAVSMYRNRNIALGIAKEVSSYLKGVPDLIVFKKGRALVNEDLQVDIKTGAGKLNRAQKRWAQGCRVHICANLIEFIIVLEGWLDKRGK